MRSDSINDSVWGFGDLVPQFTTRGAPSNIGIGYGAIDAGGGYTYFNGHSPNEPKAQIPSIINGFCPREPAPGSAAPASYRRRARVYSILDTVSKARNSSGGPLR